MSLLRFLLVLANAFGLFAQNSNFAVSGKVTDTSGGSVPRALVVLYSRSGPERYSATSNAQGEYLIAVPKGRYLVDADAPNLHLSTSPLSVDVASPLQLPLQLGIGGVNSAIEVTATGIAQSLNETAKAIDIVDRAELDQRAIQSAADGIRELPGIRIEQRGGPGYNTTIQIRGLRTFDTAVLIDGMRFRDVDATQGDASSFLTDLLVVDTARIEVLRGAGSSVYGTNAIGGVINIVTDSGIGPFHGSVTADGGGLGEFRGVARFGGGALHNRLHYSAGAGHQNVTDNVGGYGTYRNTTGNGLADYTFKPGLVLGGRLLATDVFGQLYNTANAAPAATLASTGYLHAVALPDSQILLAEQKLPYQLSGATFIPALGDPDYYRTARFLSALVYLQQQVNAPLSYRVSYQALLSNRNVVNGPLGAGSQPAYRTSNQFNGRIDTLRAQANYAAGAHNLLSAGYEFEREYFDSPSLDNNPNALKQVNSRTQVSESSHTVDAQDQIRLLRDRLQVFSFRAASALRFKQPAVLGYRAGVLEHKRYQPAERLHRRYFCRLFHRCHRHEDPFSCRQRLSQAVSIRTVRDRIFGASFSAYGDPRLKPERSVAIDGGFDQYFASEKLRVSGTYFYTRLQQVIAFDSSGLITPSTDLFGRSSGYRNTGGALARGVELSTEVRPIRSTHVSASYTYANARDRFSQFADGTLQTPRVSPHTFSLVLLQQFGKHIDGSLSFVAASDFLYQLSRRTFLFPGRRQADLTLGYSRSLNERLHLRLYTRINNLGDQIYYEDGYRTPRRWAVAGVAFSF